MSTIKREVNLINEKLESNENYYIRQVTVKDTRYTYGVEIPEEIMKLETKFRNYTIKAILLDLGNKLRTTAGQHPADQDKVFKEVLVSFEPYTISLKRDIRETTSKTSKIETAEDLLKVMDKLSAEEKSKLLNMLSNK